MKPGKPSVTARFVAHTRAGLERPEFPTGDAAAELRLYRSLGSTPFPETKSFHDRMERRTRFFDRLTLAAIEGGGTQVVIVGAGYDGRPVRFASPGVTWFEVDHPSTQSDKRARLLDAGADVGAIRFVPVDLTDGDLGAALDAVGHDRARPSLFLVEGLLAYLSRPVADRVLRALRHRASPGSRMAAAFPVAPKRDLDRLPTPALDPAAHGGRHRRAVGQHLHVGGSGRGLGLLRMGDHRLPRHTAALRGPRRRPHRRRAVGHRSPGSSSGSRANAVTTTLVGPRPAAVDRPPDDGPSDDPHRAPSRRRRPASAAAPAPSGRHPRSVAEGATEPVLRRPAPARHRRPRPTPRFGGRRGALGGCRPPRQPSTTSDAPVLQSAPRERLGGRRSAGGHGLRRRRQLPVGQHPR